MRRKGPEYLVRLEIPLSHAQAEHNFGQMIDLFILYQIRQGFQHRKGCVLAKEGMLACGKASGDNAV
eukprot:1334256-Pyramimonas_sp.AAC.1